MATVTLFFVLILLVSGIAFFASSETAFLSLTQVHIKSLVRAKAKGAKTVMRLWTDIDSLLSLVLIGTNFLDALAASISTALAVRVGGKGAFLLATLGTTAAITVFGEIVPKTFSLSHADKAAFMAAPVLLTLRRIFRPVIALFSLVSRFVNFIAMHIVHSADEGVTEAEVKMIIDVGAAEGTLEKSERDMIYKIFTLSDISVRTFMRHRSLVESVSPAATKEEVRAAFCTGHSHIPVVEGDDVFGVLSYTSVLFPPDCGTTPDCGIAPGRATAAESTADFARRNMTEPLFIPETHTATAVLSRFKEAGEDFAVVLDEQGSFSGIVTMDCLARVVFARMADDSLSPALTPSERVRVISGKECILPGDMRIEDANDLLPLHLASDDFVTIGGWLLEQFGYLPSVGEVFVKGGYAFFVEDQAHRRILSVRIKGVPARYTLRPS